MARSGSIDWGAAPMSAHGSPRSATNSGTERMVSSSGTTVSTSSHVSGVDTCPPTRGRANQAPKTVLCGAFWLKSTKTRVPRSSFHHLAVISSGWRRSSSRARATAAARTAIESQRGSSRRYTCSPLLPVVFG